MVVSVSDLPEYAVNDSVMGFTYPHGEGYMHVMYFFNDDGYETILIASRSADGLTIDPILICSGAINDPDITVDMDSIVLTADGTVYTETEYSDDGSIRKSAEIRTEDDTPVASYEMLVTPFGDGYIADIAVVGENNEGTMVQFTSLGDVRGLSITNDEGTSVLTYNVADGQIDIGSAVAVTEAY